MRFQFCYVLNFLSFSWKIKPQGYLVALFFFSLNAQLQGQTPTAQITAATTSVTAAEGGSALIDVELSAGTGTCDVNVTTMDGSATKALLR